MFRRWTVVPSDAVIRKLGVFRALQLKVAEFNARERCDRDDHYSNGNYQAWCDDCGAHLLITPATAV